MRALVAAWLLVAPGALACGPLYLTGPAEFVCADEKLTESVKYGTSVWQKYVPYKLSVSKEKRRTTSKELFYVQWVPDGWVSPYGRAICTGAKGGHFVASVDDNVVSVGRCARNLKNSVAHELGHVLGLGHSLDGGLMGENASDDSWLSGSTLEELCAIYGGKACDET